MAVRELIEVHENTGSTSTVQERNRLWWEAAPMTYRDWCSAARELAQQQDFEDANRMYFATNPWLKRWFDNFASSPQCAGLRILEIGCGAGTAACRFANLGSEVTAIDITDKAVKMTRMNAEFQNVRVDVHQMDAEDLQFEDQSFDFVYSWGVIHHSSNTRRALAEIARVLRLGGRGLIMVYNKNSLRYYVKGLEWLIVKGKILQGESLDSVQKYFTDGYLHRHFKSNELRNLLKSMQLQAVNISKTHMNKQYLPLLPGSLDDLAKSKLGWLLIAEFGRV